MSRNPDVPLPFTSAFSAQQAQAVGITANSLTRRVRGGEVVRLRRGVYAPAQSLTSRQIIDSALLTAPQGSVLGFESAAVLLNMPLPRRGPLRRVDLYARNDSPHGGGRPPHEVRMHYVDLPTTQQTVVEGIPVTSLARTAIDVSRSLPLGRALIAIDHARRQGVRLQHLYDARYSVAGNRGVGILDDALRHSSPLAESALESMSRGVFILGRLPTPVLQEPLRGASGEQYRVDFYWPATKLIGEADGFVKYADDADAFRREKAREDDLRLAGYMVVRWTWDELIQTPHLVTTRILDRLATSLR